MRLIGLQPGAAVSKQEIEAALQRLADSGLFADLSYTVGPEALTFVVKPVAGALDQHVRFSNFVWWQPGELEPLVEARVPLFHGSLPVAGQLTTQVQQALVTLLSEKGIPNATVEAMQSQIGGAGLALTITRPPITVGEVHLTGSAPEAAEQMNNVAAHLASRDYDAIETPTTIVQNALDTQRNAGYLDAAVDPPVFSPPRKHLQGYALDASASIHPGALYHVAGVSYAGVDPNFQTEVAKATGIKIGSPAEEMQLHIGEGLAARALQNHGLLEAAATAEVAKDSGNHSVVYQFHLKPGPVYTLTAVDVSALPSQVQARFQSNFHTAPGQIADGAVRTGIASALNSAGVLRSVVMDQKLDRTNHTVTYVVHPGAARPARPAPPV